MLNTQSTMYHRTTTGGGGGGFQPDRTFRRTTTANSSKPRFESSDLIGTDYFVSSLDFEYDLFLNGLVNYDNSGYRTKRTSAASITGKNSHITDIDLFGDSEDVFCRYESNNNNQPEFGRRSTYLPSSRSSSSRHNESSLTESLFSALSSPLSRHRNTTGNNTYRYLVEKQSSSTTSPTHRSCSNDYISFPFHNQPTTNGLAPLPSSSLSSSVTSSTQSYTTNINNNNNPPPTTNRPRPIINSNNNNNNIQSSLLKSGNDSITVGDISTATDFSPVGCDNNLSTDEALSHQQLHALHRFRQQRKKGLITRLRDVVISFSPKSRGSLLNRNDIYARYGKEERDALAAFDFLYVQQTEEEEIILQNPDPEVQSPPPGVEVTEPPEGLVESIIDLDEDEYYFLHPFPCDTSTGNSINTTTVSDHDDDGDVDDDDNDDDDDDEDDDDEEEVILKKTGATNQSNVSPRNDTHKKIESSNTWASCSLPSPSSNTKLKSKNPSQSLSPLKSPSAIGLQKKLYRFAGRFPRKSSSLEFKKNSTTNGSAEDDESGCSEALTVSLPQQTGYNKKQQDSTTTNIKNHFPSFSAKKNRKKFKQKNNVDDQQQQKHFSDN